MCLHDFARFINACSKRAQGQTLKTTIKPMHLSSFSQKHLLNIKRYVYITLRFSRCMLEGGDRGRLGPPCRSHNPPRAWFLSLVCSEMPQWNANSPRDPAKSKPWRSQATTKANATNKSKRISQDLSALLPGPAECAKRLKSNGCNLHKHPQRMNGISVQNIKTELK